MRQLYNCNQIFSLYSIHILSIKAFLSSFFRGVPKPRMVWRCPTHESLFAQKHSLNFYCASIYLLTDVL